MNKKLQNKLFAKYPKLFRQRTLPPEESAMCFGIDCEDGWYQLIDCLCYYITKLAPDVEAMQVKEKFGGLRFYVNAAPQPIHDIINFFESVSTRFCEKCGVMDNVEVAGPGWIQSLCKKCRKKNIEVRRQQR